jgi:hypothetical protein
MVEMFTIDSITYAAFVSVETGKCSIYQLLLHYMKRLMGSKNEELFYVDFEVRNI